MAYDYTKLENLIKTEEDRILAQCAQNQYHDALDDLMGKNIDKDIDELSLEKPKNAKDMQRCAIEATEKRMHKYGSQFFEDELERLMDSFNKDNISKQEYLIRCEILGSVTDSLLNFKSDKRKG